MLEIVLRRQLARIEKRLKRILEQGEAVKGEQHYTEEKKREIETVIGRI